MGRRPVLIRGTRWRSCITHRTLPISLPWGCYKLTIAIGCSYNKNTKFWDTKDLPSVETTRSTDGMLLVKKETILLDEM